MPHKIDKAEWRPILRAASELLARVVLAGVDGRISRDEAAAILPLAERFVASIRGALED
jgi:hypothetical protein